MNCKATGCTNQATCAPGLVFWPPKVIRRFRAKQPIATIVADREVCDDCIEAVIKDGYKHLLPQKQFDSLVRSIVAAKRQAVQISDTEVVRMEFDSRDYVALARRLYGPDAAMVLVKEALDARKPRIITGIDLASGPDETRIAKLLDDKGVAESKLK